MHLFRWALHSEIGFPRAPFTVWSRPANKEGTPVPLPSGSVTVAQVTPRVIQLPAQAMRVWVTVNTPAGSLTLDAYDSGGTRITGLSVNPGASGQTVALTGSGIASVRVSGAGRVDSVSLIVAEPYANLPDWTPVEVVGLPVEASSGLPYNPGDQGLTGALTAPSAAAIERLQRAAPQAGWPTASGIAVPAWAPPAFNALVDSYQQTLVTDLMSMLTDVGDPLEQRDYRTSNPLPQPEDQLGGPPRRPRSLGDSTASVAPLGLLALACHGDIYAALALGFATGYAAGQQAFSVYEPGVDYMVHGATTSSRTASGSSPSRSRASWPRSSHPRRPSVPPRPRCCTPSPHRAARGPPAATGPAFARSR